MGTPLQHCNIKVKVKFDLKIKINSRLLFLVDTSLEYVKNADPRPFDFFEKSLNGILPKYSNTYY